MSDSATNYGGVSKNDGALLHVFDAGNKWIILPKYIDYVAPTADGDAWAQDPERPPTPLRRAPAKHF